MIRPVNEVVNAPISIVRDHRVFARPGLAETRVLNPEVADRMYRFRHRRPRYFPGACPAGGEHDHTGSGDYTLVINRPGAQGQANWRWCSKCQGLAFGGHAGGTCIKGGQHDFGASADYVLAANTVPAGHQPDWLWCRKCDGLAYNGQPSGCPAGGAHDHVGSGNYALAVNMPEAEGQPNWRWCRKCMSLAYAGAGDAVGATREELALPVASSDPVVDDAVFEAASGPERFHLPRYRIARRLVDGSEQYLIRMKKDEAGQASLVVTLDRLRPPGLPEDTQELDHEILLNLSYALTMSGGGSATKTLPFTEVGETDDGSQVIARMQFASPAERDQVLSAITTAGTGCGIVALRSVRVAAPIAGLAGRFRPVTRGLPQTVEPDPLFLLPSLHPYIHGGAAPVAGGAPGLVTRQLLHGGRFHKYWEDAANPARAFYLPDAFRLARRDKPAPFLPLMGVRLVPGATAEADPMVALDFVATPWIDVKRLEAARKELARSLPPAADGTPAESRLRLEPLPVSAASFWLALPGVAGGGLAERPGAQVDVGAAVIISETLSLGDFQTVFDALMGGALAIMRGEVRVDFGQGVTERIPFEARFDRMNGDLFEPEVAAGAAPGEFSVLLRNAIESPVRVDRLEASVLAGSDEVAASETFSSPLPVTLGPGESLSLVIAATGAVPDGAPVEPLLNVDGVEVLPNGETIWTAIFGDVAGTEARRTVRVKLFAGMFDGVSGRPEDKALAIIVQFEGGATVELTPDKMEGEARIAGSLADIVLRRGGSSAYRYKTQVIRRTTRLADADWRSDSSDLLIPLLPAE